MFNVRIGWLAKWDNKFGIMVENRVGDKDSCKIKYLNNESIQV